MIAGGLAWLSRALVVIIIASIPGFSGIQIAAVLLQVAQVLSAQVPRSADVDGAACSELAD